VAAGVLTLVLMGCWWLRASPVEIGESEPSARPDNLFAKTDSGLRAPGLRELLAPLIRSKVFWLTCGLSLGATVLKETFQLWTPMYFTQAAGMTPGAAAGMSALYPFFGGVSVMVCGWLSDRLGRAGRAGVVLGGLLLSAGLLFMSSRTLPVLLVSLVAFLTIGPYSLLGGAIAMDFGGKTGSGTACGIIDGIGYLGGVLAGGTMARVSVAYGWNGAFLVLALIAFLSSVAAAFFLREQAGKGELNGHR